jgi:hypothetical protein
MKIVIYITNILEQLWIKNFLKENNFQNYSREFIKNLGSMPDHKKVKLTENINNKVLRTSPTMYIPSSDAWSKSPRRGGSVNRRVIEEISVRLPDKSLTLLNKYKSTVPRLINDNTTSDNTKEMKKSRHEILESLDKQFGLKKSPNHQRNRTFNFLKSGDFYY